MITINLRPGQKRKRAGSPLAKLGEGIRGLRSKIQDPMLLGAVVAWVIVLGGIVFIYVGTAAKLSALEPEMERAQSENQRFKVLLADKRRQEIIRDSLAAQIQTIRQVDGDRYIWPHVLDEVTKALPPYTWLIDMGSAGSAAPPLPPDATAADSAAAAAAARRVNFQLNGRTIDIQSYTKFLRQLEASPWITDVIPVSAQTVVEKERAVTAFTIRATYQAADSAYIRTVPLSQSVR